MPLSNSRKQGDIKDRPGTWAPGPPALTSVHEHGILMSAGLSKREYSSHSPCLWL